MLCTLQKEKTDKRLCSKRDCMLKCHGIKVFKRNVIQAKEYCNRNVVCLTALLGLKGQE